MSLGLSTLLPLMMPPGQLAIGCIWVQDLQSHCWDLIQSYWLPRTLIGQLAKCEWILRTRCLWLSTVNLLTVLNSRRKCPCVWGRGIKNSGSGRSVMLTSYFQVTQDKLFKNLLLPILQLHNCLKIKKWLYTCHICKCIFIYSNLVVLSHWDNNVHGYWCRDVITPKMKNQPIKSYLF